ncbi:MAG: HAMP domain-containing histidine kinase [Lachnospiraceae bacterium]|jgi:signal transduction histidine kinase|nr:HAMP domain-containing histidine kinase [Lachnospiraceae bacterium]
MEQRRWHWYVLAFVQHLLLAILSIVVAYVMFHMQVRIQYEPNVYYTVRVNFLTTDPAFEESETFLYWTENAIDKIVEEIVLRSQLETAGQLDWTKKMDVVSLVQSTRTIRDDVVSVAYRLKDLLTWRESQLSWESEIMTKKEFIQYFEPDIFSTGHFSIDEDKQLYFHQNLVDQSNEEASIISNLMKSKSESQLVDMVFDDIAWKLNWDGYLTSGSDDDTVRFSKLICPVSTTEGHDTLIEAVDNWEDFFELQTTVEAAIEKAYELYTKHRYIQFDQTDSNVAYAAQLGNELITNRRGELISFSTDEINEYFSNLGFYARCSFYDLAEPGNDVYQEYLYSAILESGYDFGEDSRFWVGAALSYPLEKNSLFDAMGAYDFLKYREEILIFACVLVFGWGALVIYRTLCAKRRGCQLASVDPSVSGKSLKVRELSNDLIDTRAVGTQTGINVISIEWYFAAGAIVTLLSWLFWYDLWKNWFYSYSFPSQRMYLIVFVMGVVGFFLSVTILSMWYNLVERFFAKSLWKTSSIGKICRWLVQRIRDVNRIVITNKNRTIRIFIPYLLFLALNFGGFYLLISTVGSERTLDMLFQVAVVVVLIVCDCYCAYVLMSNAAQRKNIMRTIVQIREGDVNQQLDPEKFKGENKELVKSVNRIGEGIRRAVETSMKDERLKTELITNVSHDIRTPLTSIINYVGLIKREQQFEEPVKGYLEILDAKSQRLKQLTDDLLEASKITSGNIVYDYKEMDLSLLLLQAIGEFSEKMEESHLHLMFTPNEEPMMIVADANKLWRVVENLFQNVCKYAMPYTRVYLDITKEADQITTSLKNISDLPLNMTEEEFTERFVRGDEARTTEGSGLGLSIAKSLVRAQGGSFSIETDGDLFKVLIRFPIRS